MLTTSNSLSQMSHDKLIRILEAVEAQNLEETDRVLARVFRKAAMKAMAEGNMRDLRKWRDYLNKVKEL